MILRKPLEAGDLAVHLKWRFLHLAWRRTAGGSEPTVHSVGLPDMAPPAVAGCSLLRNSGLLALKPVYWFLRAIRKAGGFTLFVRAQKL